MSKWPFSLARLLPELNKLGQGWTKSWVEPIEAQAVELCLELLLTKRKLQRAEIALVVEMENLLGLVNFALCQRLKVQ